MKEFTQTSFGTKGNCWQTSVACVLDLDPATLPDQSVCDLVDAEGHRQPPYYGNRLRAYLKKHHGLLYIEVYPTTLRDAFLGLKEPGYHFLTGTTERTGTPGGAPRHVVVARHGEMIWDPHPSRAGLLGEIKTAVLVPFPPEWDRGTVQDDQCECPACIDARASEASNA
jgi:hypothetical protein